MDDQAMAILNVTFRGVMAATSYRNGSDIKYCPFEEERDVQYKEFYEIAQIITGLFIYPMAIFPGLVGNALTIFVLSRRNMRTSTNAFLSALAISDSFKLINDMLYFFVTLFLRTSTDLGNLAYGYLYPYAHFVFTMSVCVSSWLTVSVAVERYILVCHPTRARALWNRKRAVMLCTFIYIIMTSLALPSALRYRTILCVDRQTNISRLEVELTEIWENQLLITAYDWAQNLLRSIIPLLVLVVLNACIISALRRTKAKKRKNSRHRVTIMMLVVILVFLVCITPDAILSTVFGFGYHEAGYLGKGIREFTDSLLTINAGVNFLIYCAFNQVFRKSFARLCFPKTRQTNWMTELDESTYRRLSEAKSLLSSNNNSPPRKDTPTSGKSDSSKYRNVNNFCDKGKNSDTSDGASTAEGGSQWASSSNPDNIRQSMSSLTSYSSSTDSHYNRSHLHNQRRVSSSGLKKSRNSIKTNRARKKGNVTFSDSPDSCKQVIFDGESTSDMQNLGKDIHVCNKSSLRKNSSNIKIAIQSKDDSSQFTSTNGPTNVINNVEDTTPTEVRAVDTGDAEKLASFSVCDGSQILQSNIYSNGVDDTSNMFDDDENNDDKMCMKESIKANNKKCYLSVLFIDKSTDSTESGLSKEKRTQERNDVSYGNGANCVHAGLRYKGGKQASTTSNNVETINEHDLRDSEYLPNSHLHDVVLTTDV